MILLLLLALAALILVVGDVCWPTNTARFQRRTLHMNPFVKALAGTVTRWLMVLAGAHGVPLSDGDAATVANAVLIVGALAWSAYQKWATAQCINTAEMQVDLRGRG